VRKSILEAIKQGEWDYEPKQVQEELFNPTAAVPGSDEKLLVMAERVRAGLPIWHGKDRRDYEDLR
jgi:hypothetical protein